MKGIVLGKKYTTKNGQLSARTRPSLPAKVEYVKLNRSFYLDSSVSMDFKGLIVIADYPPISIFNGIGIISLNEIKLL